MTGEPLHFRLRTAKESDAEQIARVWRSSIRTLCAPAYDFDETLLSEWADDKTPEKVSQLIQCEEVFMVADAAGMIAGFFCATFALDTFALYVDPAFVRRGVGSRLFRCYEKVAQEYGQTRLHFLASLNAIEFYESCGCHQSGAMVKTPRKAYPMEKEL